MSHALVVVIVPKETKDIYAEVERLMAPYDENIKVEPYIELTRDKVVAKKEEITKEVSSTPLLKLDDYLRGYKGKIKKMSLEEFAKSWYGKESDSEGNLLTTYNPKSKWDWYVIGGRWDGEVQGKPRDDSEGVFNFGDEHHQLKYNTCLVSELAFDFVPYAIITPDGYWHEKGRLGWWGVTINPLPGDSWEAEAVLIFGAYRGCLAIGVDYHI